MYPVIANDIFLEFYHILNMSLVPWFNCPSCRGVRSVIYASALLMSKEKKFMVKCETCFRVKDGLFLKAKKY